MRLFEVKAGIRVRIVARNVRYLVQKGISVDVARGVTYEGETTDGYVELDGSKRRLIINLNVNFWSGFGVWQSDCDCEIVE